MFRACLDGRHRKLLPSLNLIKAEGFVFVDTLVTKLLDVVDCLSRSEYRNDPSLLVAKSVVMSERKLLKSGVDMREWAAGLTERMSEVAGVGGFFGYAVQEGVQQVKAEIERPGQKVLLKEEFKALAVAELDLAEQALRGVQGDMGVKPLSVSLVKVVINGSSLVNSVALLSRWGEKQFVKGIWGQACIPVNKDGVWGLSAYSDSSWQPRGQSRLLGSE